MAANKYLELTSAGVTQEQTPAVTSAGSADANRLVALDSTGHLDNSVLPTGIGADTANIVASEALSAGDLVNVWSNAGTANVRKADASTTGKEAHGFVLAAVLSSATATVYFEGTDTQMTGLTPGVQFLSDTTPGKTTSTAPTTSGHVVQRVGFATSATAMNFQSEIPITRA